MVRRISEKLPSHAYARSDPGGMKFPSEFERGNVGAGQTVGQEAKIYLAVLPFEN